MSTYTSLVENIDQSKNNPCVFLHGVTFNIDSKKSMFASLFSDLISHLSFILSLRSLLSPHSYFSFFSLSLNSNGHSQTKGEGTDCELPFVDRMNAGTGLVSSRPFFVSCVCPLFFAFSCLLYSLMLLFSALFCDTCSCP